MGFYLKDSVSVGPFRFNLSKSGIGLSVGVTGLRFGLGPRGRYVHAGRGGLYYRKTFSSKPEGLLFQPPPRESTVPQSAQSLRTGSLNEIDSTSLTEMHDSDHDDFINEINSLKNISDLWPVVAAVSAAVAIGLLVAGVSNWFVGAALLVGLFATKTASDRDAIRKSIALLYDLEPEAKNAFAQLHDAFEKLGAAERVWHIEAQGDAEDPRYQAGATQIVRRQRIIPKLGLPPFLQCNLDTPVLPVGRQELYFLPDLILVRDASTFGAIGYHDLKLEIRASQFIEENDLPAEAEVVEYTWKYVNKKGTPDKRFKDNRQLPVVRYEEIRFTNPAGLNELIQISRKGIGAHLESAINAIATHSCPKKNPA